MANWVSLPLSYTVPTDLSLCIGEVLLIINNTETKLARQKKAIQWRPLETEGEWNQTSQSSRHRVAQASWQKVSGDLLSRAASPVSMSTRVTGSVKETQLIWGGHS